MNEIVDFEVDITTLAEEATTFQVVTLADCEKASEVLSRIKEMRDHVLEELQPSCDTAHKAWKTAVATRDRNLKPLDDATLKVKQAVADWQDNERRKQNEIMRLAQIKAEVEEMEAREAEAEELRKQGKAGKEAAKELLAAPVIVPIAAPPPLPKVSGVSTGDKYDFKIVDEAKIPRQYLMVNEKAIRAAVQSQKNMCNIPGVQVIVSTQVRQTKRK